MKKQLLYLIVSFICFGVFFATSCKKNKKDDLTPAGKLEGTYLAYDTTYYKFIPGQTQPSCPDPDAKTYPVFITENTENTIHIVGLYQNSDTLNATVSGNFIIISGGDTGEIIGDKIFIETGYGVPFCEPNINIWLVRQQ